MMDALGFAWGAVGALIGFFICLFEYRWAQKQITEMVFPKIRTALVICFLAGAFLFIYLHHGMSLRLFTLASLCGILVAVVLTDLDTWTIPNSLISVGVLLWAVTIWFASVPVPGEGLDTVFGLTYTYAPGTLFSGSLGTGFFPVFMDGILAAFIVGGGLFIFSAVYEQVRKKPSLGGGDIKLIFMTGLFLGVQASVINLFLACVVGLLFSAVWSMRGENKGSDVFPFGPSIAIATFITLCLMTF